MYKLIVAGGREFNDYDLLCDEIDNFITDIEEDLEIVSGMARGADTLGILYGKQNSLKITRFPADWSKGKSAGMIRNREMADYADGLLAFYDGVSKGTGGMISIASKLELDIKIINY